MKNDENENLKKFLLKCLGIWVLFNFLVLMFKLNNLDDDKVPAWHLIKWVWYVDIFLLWGLIAAAVIVGGYVLYEVISEYRLSHKKVNTNKEVSSSSSLLEEKPLTEMAQINETNVIEPKEVIPKVPVTETKKLEPKVKSKKELRKDLLNNLMGRDFYE